MQSLAVTTADELYRFCRGLKSKTGQASRIRVASREAVLRGSGWSKLAESIANTLQNLLGFKFTSSKQKMGPELLLPKSSPDDHTVLKYCRKLVWKGAKDLKLFD